MGAWCFVARRLVSFRLDEGLLARVDGARGELSRTGVVEGALEEWLGREAEAAVWLERHVPVRAVSSSVAKAGVVPVWRRGTE